MRRTYCKVLSKLKDKSLALHYNIRVQKPGQMHNTPMRQLSDIMTNRRASTTSHTQYKLSPFPQYINNNGQGDFHIFIILNDEYFQ